MKKIKFFIALAMFACLFSGCKNEDDTKDVKVDAEIALRNATEEDEPNLEVRVKALILDVKGTDIVSGYAGLFESDKVAETEYDKAVAAFPLDQSDIKAINSEAGWTKRFDNQRNLKPEEDGSNCFKFVAVVKLTNKAGTTETFTATEEPIVELPPM